MNNSLKACDDQPRFSLEYVVSISAGRSMHSKGCTGQPIAYCNITAIIGKAAVKVMTD